MISFTDVPDVQFTSEIGEVRIYLNSDFIEYVTGMLIRVDSEVVEGFCGTARRYADIVEITDITSIKFRDGTVKEMKK